MSQDNTTRLMSEAVAKAISALDKAEKQFTRYAEHHKLQADAAYVTKIERERRLAQAATNYGYAVVCGDALEHLRLASHAQ
jgi:hypothetical protein